MRRQDIADAPLHRLRYHEPALNRALGRERWVHVDRLPILSWAALGLHAVGQGFQIIRYRSDSGQGFIGAIEPLRFTGVEIEGSGHGVWIIDVGRGGGRRIAVAITEEYLVGKAQRLAVGPRTAQYRLMIVVAHRVLIGQ